MKRTAEDDLEVTCSCGNIFRDMGRRNADELLAKAELSLVLTRAINKRGLTQRAAAEILGVAPSDVSDLIRGKLKRFSYERLIRFVVKMGVDVSIRTSQRPAGRRRAALTVEIA